MSIYKILYNLVNFINHYIYLYDYNRVKIKKSAYYQLRFLTK